MKESFVRRRLIGPVIGLLKQGITPEKLALSLAFGIVLGVFPVLGTTTALCAGAALAFRLNIAAIQLVNYFVYPLQIALIMWFIRMGERLFGAERLEMSVTQMVTMFQADLWGAADKLGLATLRAIAVWALLGIPAIVVLFAVLTPLLRRVARRQQAPSA